MDAQRWLEAFRAELDRRRLPPLYVERMARELSDHITDFMEDRMSTDAKDLRHVLGRLGPPGEIAAAAASEFRKARFSARHPVVTFVLLPIVALALCWTAAIFVFLLGAGAVSWLWNGSGEGLPEWLIAILPVTAGGIVLVPIALVAALVCRIARRAAIGWKWPLAACLLLAVIGGAAFFDVKLSSIDRGVLHGTKFKNVQPVPDAQHGQLMLGFGLNQYPRPWQIAQFSIPLAICGWFVWRQAVQRRQHVLAG